MPKHTTLPKGLLRVEPFPKGDRYVEVECVQLTTGTGLTSEAIEAMTDLLLHMAKRKLAQAMTRPDHHLKGHGADASGHLVPEGFVVHKESRLAKTCVKALPAVAKELRSELEKHGVIALQGDELVVERECTFESPSLAAEVVLGRPSNKLRVWKDWKGRTIEENQAAAVGGGADHS